MTVSEHDLLLSMTYSPRYWIYRRCLNNYTFEASFTEVFCTLQITLFVIIFFSNDIDTCFNFLLYFHHVLYCKKQKNEYSHPLVFEE